MNIEEVKIKKDTKKKIFIPVTNIRLNQVENINNVWPKSGWIINKNKTGKIIKILKIYLELSFDNLLELNIIDKTTIKKGFIISTGWNLGSITGSNNRLEPFASTP